MSLLHLEAAACLSCFVTHGGLWAYAGINNTECIAYVLCIQYASHRARNEGMLVFSHDRFSTITVALDACLLQNRQVDDVPST